MSTLRHFRKGNDQVRLEEAFYALKPDVRILAPWRMPEFYETFKGCSDLLASLKIQILRRPAMWKLTADPILSAADEPEDVTIEFEKGIPVKITAQSTGTETETTKLFLAANALA